MTRHAAVVLSLLMILSPVTATAAVAAPGSAASPAAAAAQPPPDVEGDNGTTAQTSGTDRASDLPIVTGFHHPRIDGQLYGHTGQPLPEGAAPEWTDGYNASTTFVDGDGEVVEGRVFTKSIGRSLYTAALAPGIEGVTSSEELAVRLRLDRDGDGSLSAGDVELTARPEAGGDRSPHMTIRRVEVYRDGEFVPIDDPGVSTVGTVALRSTDAGTAIEARTDTGALDELLGNPIPGSEGGTRIGFDIRVETARNRYDLRGVDDRYAVSGVGIDRSRLPFPRLDVGVDHVEVTQTVQTRNNTLGLVENKTTLARVFVDHDATGPTSVDVTVTALAPRSGTSCPCSVVGTRSTTFTAPAGSLNRSKLNHSANVRLPDAWTRAGPSTGSSTNDSSLVLRATVRPSGIIPDRDQSDNELTESVVFTRTYNPVIATIRVNEGTASNPVQESTTNASRMKTYLRHAYPVAEVRYSELGREILGPQKGVSDDGLISNLNTVSERLALGRAIALGLGLYVPPTDQVYGVSDRNRGLSDPSWYYAGTDSEVAFGDVGYATSTFWVPYTVMSHEINHNLGNDTWGRHVASSFTEEGNGIQYGCDAGGPDGEWQRQFDDGEIHEVGWLPTNGTVPAGVPDFMSYCATEDREPSLWTSDYRWQRLLERFRTWDPGNPVHPDERPVSTSTTASRLSTRQAEPSPNSTARVISGTLYRNGSGALDPSFEQPGFTRTPSPAVEEPRAILVVEYADRDPLRLPLDARFTTVEGDEVDADSFTVSVPDDGGVEAIRLLDADTGEPLDSLEGTGFGLESAAVEVPERFERDEPVDVPVSVETDVPEDRLYTQLLYSPEPDAELWYPLGSPVAGVPTRERPLRPVFTELPGGSGARFLVLVSDGVDTRAVESDRFTVEPLPPEVAIDDADRRIHATAGDVVSIDASARDQLGRSLPADALTWTLRDADGAVVADDSGRTFAARIDEPGEYRLTVTGTAPRTETSGDDTATVVVEPPSLPTRSAVEEFDAALEAASTTGPAVRLEPTTRDVTVEETTAFDVVVTGVEGGVGSYELVVTTDRAAIARIVDAENRIGGTGRIDPAEDGSSVRVGAFAGDTADTGNVTVATVTVAGVEPGTAGLAVEVDSVSDEAGEGYDLEPATDLATVAVREQPQAPEVVAGRPATDPDGDGVYEDVNGDGEVNPGDATVLFNAVFENNEAVTANPARFDLNRDGSVNPGDATVLFDEAFGS